MSSGKTTAPTVSVLAEHVSDHLSVFVVAEDTDAKRPANEACGFSITRAMRPASQTASGWRD